MKLPTIDEWNAAHDSNRKMIHRRRTIGPWRTLLGRPLKNIGLLKRTD